MHPASVYKHMGRLIDFLAEHPFYGEEYDPHYPAAMPPVSCRVFFCGRYDIYYHVDDDRRTITVLAIESTSMDSMGRFS